MYQILFEFNKFYSVAKRCNNALCDIIDKKYALYTRQYPLTLKLLLLIIYIYVYVIDICDRNINISLLQFKKHTYSTLNIYLVYTRRENEFLRYLL